MKTRNDSSAGGVVFRIGDDGVEVVVIRTHEGRWQLPKGWIEPDETMEQTAVREVREETGLDAGAYELTRWDISNRYEIYERWRHRYAPGVTHNTEHVFGLRLPAQLPVVLAPREHLRYVWVPWEAAAERCFSPSNAAAIRLLPARL
mgnify:CR=1 FL=1